MLKPFAIMLRFYTRGMSSRLSLRQVREIEKAERVLADFMSHEAKYLEYLPVADGLRVEEVLQDLQRRLRDAKAQAAAQLANEDHDA